MFMGLFSDARGVTHGATGRRSPLWAEIPPEARVVSPGGVFDRQIAAMAFPLMRCII
jgi:hypothetical protein